jgi:Fe2+ transport system protein FeoA
MALGKPYIQALTGMLTQAIMRTILKCKSGVEMKQKPFAQLNLSCLRKGQTGKILGIHAPDGTRQRMQSMGLRTGHEAEVIRCSRFGPMHIRIGSVHLIMRRCDAARVSISSHQ